MQDLPPTRKRPARYNANSIALACLRVSIGVLFVIFGQYKVFGRQFVFEGGFEGWIRRFLSESAYPFMVPVLQDFVLPHARPIALLVAYGELAIGIALVIGVLTRTASLFGAVFMLALLFSSDYPGADARLWQYFGASLEHLVLAMCFAAFVAGRPEEVLSLQSARRNIQET